MKLYSSPTKVCGLEIKIYRQKRRDSAFFNGSLLALLSGFVLLAMSVSVLSNRFWFMKFVKALIYLDAQLRFLLMAYTSSVCPVDMCMLVNTVRCPLASVVHSWAATKWMW
ncbi:hypothetical protein L1286_13430 [Pseudoalteromonas sp. SMS1]|uniref:hypothetical protein n=1 Tax=Pseudoalteromonas sp. SMS1 TaxID=2908894 RepID=UPI001F459C17|nr:hypothetical protein [Pseudoalteromonas sp. SMS1]MCF2858483.1 hypothetical protein [Pseudoalteromonas sp. SMS1]